MRLLGILAGGLTLWNAVAYPSGAGYDAASHREYADFLIQHHRLPYRNETPEYYSPPLYYLVAGAVTWVGRQAGLGDPKYAPCPLLRQYVQAGRLGRQSGRGFYAYG